MRKIKAIKSAVIEANFHWTYVRVYSDVNGGLYGTGECFFAPGIEKMISAFEEILVGEDFSNTEKLVEKMRWAASGTGSLGGIIWNAISGIEAALLDLKGKYYGLPIYQLLGGKFRDKARIYLDCHAAGSLEALNTLLQPARPTWMEITEGTEPDQSEIKSGARERAKQMVDLGYTALKFDLDLPGSVFDNPQGYSLTNKDIDWMVELVDSVRDGAGSETDIAFDAHWRYKAHDIIKVMKEIEQYRVLWLEDPLPPHDLSGLGYLRKLSHVPIATGENLQLQQGFKPLMERGLVDIVTPDLQKAGGLMEGKKIADLANAGNKMFAPHMIGSPIALMASCHLSLTIPNFLVCEFHAHDVPFFHDLAEGGTSEWFEHGWVTPSEKPGLGIELDEKVVKEYLHSESNLFK
jgi:L-alanine-DL-glutamate epimerase-like enolase superfamily enzyme